MDFTLTPDFSFSFLSSPIATAALVVAVIAAAWLMTVYRSAIASVRAYNRSSARTMMQRAAHSGSPSASVAVPPLSVIVYCKDSAEALSKMLPELFAQDYPAPIEVIVTSDGRSEQASDVVKLLSAEHRNLRLTYVPDEAHALSRKKLAVALGIKSAKYDHVLLTDANVVIPSYQWLSLMGRHLVGEGTDIVIGHSTIADRRGKRLRGLAAFDALATSTQWLSTAIAGRPCRGSDCNLAFARRLFFDNKGFADTVGFHYGIDDIFLSAICRHAKAAVEIAPQTAVTRGVENVRAAHRADKMLHLFTGRRVSHRQSRLFGLSSLMMWLWLAATALTFIFGWPSLLPLCIAVAFGIAWIAVDVAAWRGAAHTLQMEAGTRGLALRMFMRPLSNLLYRLRSRRAADANYTWSKPF